MGYTKVAGGEEKMNHEELIKRNAKRKISQICYVTNDYKKTIEYFYKCLDMGPWTILSHESKVTTDVIYKGEKVTGPFKFFCAFTQVGDIQIEVIQPVYGHNPYSEFLKKKGEGIHHIKECIPNNKELILSIEDFNNKGSPTVFQGKYQEDLFFYLDTFNVLGGYYELGNCPDINEHPTLVGYYPEKNKPV